MAEFTASVETTSSSGSSQLSDSSQIVLHRELSPLEELSENAIEDGNPSVKEYYCGFGKSRPKWMQMFRNSKFFTFILCLNALIEGALVSGKLNII